MNHVRRISNQHAKYDPFETYPIETGRLRNVVEIAAREAGWGRQLPRGQGLGIAAHRSFVTYVATVVHVVVGDKGRITIPRVDTAIDCGYCVHPERVRSQIEGAAVMGLTLAKHGAITLRNGAIQESNFNDYPLVRIHESPVEVRTHIVPHPISVPPSGVGEPGVPPFAPALCNAIFAATGKRIRQLPIGDQLAQKWSMVSDPEGSDTITAPCGVHHATLSPRKREPWQRATAEYRAGHLRSRKDARPDPAQDLFRTAQARRIAMTRGMRLAVVASAALLAAGVTVGVVSAQQNTMTFFVTSVGKGNGADLGGLEGADAHCQALAKAAGSKRTNWRAYLSTTKPGGDEGVNARDRIGKGPWRNAKGVVIAKNLNDLHSDKVNINKQTALTEKGEMITGSGETPNMHDILTGSDPDGRYSTAGGDTTCGNWTKSAEGSAIVGHHDRIGLKKTTRHMKSWNSSHGSRGCSQDLLKASGGAGLFYCFASN